MTRQQRIQRLLDKADMSRAALARYLGVYPNTIQNWFKNQASPSEKQIVQMAILFNVEPEFIWSGREPLTTKYSEVAVKYARLNKRDQNLVDQIMEGLSDDNDDQGAEIDSMPNKNGNGKK